MKTGFGRENRICAVKKCAFGREKPMNGRENRENSSEKMRQNIWP